MREHLLVSTECPTCGAPLDFPEGSTAVVCSHCKSRLLVTGRKQVLSFAIRPKVTKEAALALAIKECRGRITLCDLYFVPYYRFTAHDYLCVSGEQRQSRGVGTERIALPPVSEESEDLFDKLADHPLVELTAKKDLGELLMDLLDWLVAVAGTFFGRARDAIAPAAASGKAGSLPIPTLDAARVRTIDVDTLEVTSRHVEKNFIASRLKGSQLFSIGVRASVLRLSLFRPDELLQLGKVATVTIPVDEALERGARDVRRDTLLRATVSPALNVIYFPYWFVDDERNAGLTIVDAVSGTIVERRVPESIVTELAQTSVATGTTIGFRPLVCPNCGWDLQLRPNEVATLCTKCTRAWLLEKSELRSVRAAIADVASIQAKELVTYLPFWVMSAAGRTIFVPGFRYQNLKVLHQLASSLTGNQPRYEEGELRSGDVIGAYYDTSDAKRLAQFLHARRHLNARGEVVGPELDLGEPVLTWIPYRGKGAYFFDPFIGTNLYRNQFVT